MGENGDVVYGSGFDFDQPDVSPAIGTGKKKFPKRSSLDEEDFINLLHGSDPVKIELNRLQNELKGIYFFFFVSSSKLLALVIIIIIISLFRRL